MKIKNSILKISLVVAMLIGFGGCGDGTTDLPNGGVIGGQQDTQTTDNSNPNDFGTVFNGGNQQSSGNSQNNQNIWGAGQFPNNSNQQNILGDVEYDLASYFYDYRTWVDGSTVVQTVYNYVLNGETISADPNSPTSEMSFEKIDPSENNGNKVAVKEFKDNRENSIDFITTNSIKTYYYDEAGNALEEDSATMSRKVRVGEELFSANINSRAITCRVGDHLDNFSTADIATVSDTGMIFNYTNLLKVDCSVGDNVLLSTFYANGYGKVMSITVVNENQVSYSIVDKNSIQLFNIK